MMLARVVGRVWATIKNDTLEGKKMLVIQPVALDGRASGKQLVALDAVGAGAAELVYFCRGREASFPWLPAEVPVEAAVVGIVDEVHT
jgi:microcompartment protein CcmK/EutM